VGQTQGIEAEFTKRSEVNWSGKPDLAQRGCAQKTNIKANTDWQPRMQTLLSDPKAEVETRFGNVGAERMCLHDKWQARMQTLLSDPKAEVETRFGNAGAERMCLHGKWQPRMQTLLSDPPTAVIGLKAAPPPTSGGNTLTRSVCKPAGRLKGGELKIMM
jgi:hypothetical protein